MKKIPTLFLRDEKSHALMDIVNPPAAWVAAGEGIATRKFDGTPLLIREGRAFKRMTLKPIEIVGNTQRLVIPDNFEAAQDEPDPITGELPGWVPLTDGPADAVARDAVAAAAPSDGSYELIGPKVNGNPEGLPAHALVRHGAVFVNAVPRDFETLKAFLVLVDAEGIVWHHPDGRMVKIKGRDFGIRRPKPKVEA